jgi:hypothetical protein
MDALEDPPDDLEAACDRRALLAAGIAEARVQMTTAFASRLAGCS